MSSLVTTDTIAVVTTLANDTSMALVSILTLVALLLQKELVDSASGFGEALHRALDVAIVPLVIGFALIVAVRIADAIR